MPEHIAIAVFASPVVLLIAIYVVGKLSPNINSYKLVGWLCLLAAAVFLAFVGWYFINTGMLVSPGGRYVPPQLISSSDSVATRLFVAAINLALGLLLAWIGAFMLKLKRAPRDVPSTKASTTQPPSALAPLGSGAWRDRSLWRVSRRELVRRDVELQRQIENQFGISAGHRLSADEQLRSAKHLIERRGQVLVELAVRKARWRYLRGPLVAAMFLLLLAAAYEIVDSFAA